VPSGEISREPPRIVLDEVFMLDGPRVEDAVAHRRFALDPDAARFLGWTVDEARSAPDSHYTAVVREFIRGWKTGARLSLVIRRISDDEAVGTVELRPSSSGEADVSHLVVPELRGQGLASQAVAALLAWGARRLGLRRARIRCDVHNAASPRVAEKCGFTLRGRCGNELVYLRDLSNG
jgi:RimJ/RimL family protein N-acetyltransferase